MQLNGLLVLSTAVALALMPIQAALAGGADDGGTGGDAGDTFATATALPAFGLYHGALSSGTDNDWFVWSSPAGPASPLCVVAEVGGTAFGDVSLVSGSGPQARAVGGKATPIDAARLALAAPGLYSTSVGIESPEGLAPAIGGGYWLDVRGYGLLDMASGDGGSGRDAPGTAGSAVPIAPGCTGGTLDLARGDSADAFAVEARPGDVLTFSLVEIDGTSVVLEVLSPAGTVVTSLTSGEVARVVTGEAGRWIAKATATATDTITYMFAVAAENSAPDPEPCRPACVFSS